MALMAKNVCLYCVHLHAQFIIDRSSVDSDKDTAFRSSLSRVNTVRRPVSSTPHSKSEGSNHSLTGQNQPPQYVLCPYCEIIYMQVLWIV